MRLRVIGGPMDGKTLLVRDDQESITRGGETYTVRGWQREDGNIYYLLVAASLTQEEIQAKASTAKKVRDDARDHLRAAEITLPASKRRQYQG